MQIDMATFPFCFTWMSETDYVDTKSNLELKIWNTIPAKDLFICRVFWPATLNFCKLP